MLEFDEPCRRYDVLFHKATQSKLARMLRTINKVCMTMAHKTSAKSELLKHVFTYDVDRANRVLSLIYHIQINKRFKNKLYYSTINIIFYLFTTIITVCEYIV